MADDIAYMDRNGVGWKIVTAASAVFATPDPSSQRKYSDAPDLGPVNAQAGDAPGSKEIAALKLLIEAWAGQHAKEVAIEVTAHRDGGAGWVLLLLVLLVASDS